VFTVAAASLDSVFKFQDSNTTATTPSYVWLTNKAFPGLDSITLSLWMRVFSPGRSGTVVSYTTPSEGRVFQITSGPTVAWTLFGHQGITDVQLTPSQWTHVTVSWSSSGRYSHLVKLISASYFPKLSVYTRRPRRSINRYN